MEQLRHYVHRTFGAPEGPLKTSGLLSVLERWLKHRRFHSFAGLKFWAIVAGGAPLAEDVERFWSSMGVLLIQGYGLTEASPVVSLNHPFGAKLGTIGKPIKGLEVRIAEDGEILIRGESVVSEYLGTSDSGKRTAESGWLHTGDLGEYDSSGNLRFKGRKADIIVTSEGLNVYPRDVETLLDQLPELSGSAVVGWAKTGDEEVHAVLLLKEQTADLPKLIRGINRELEPHQRIRGWTVWPNNDFPRTPSTLKVDRAKILQQLRATAEDSRTRISTVEDGLPERLSQLLAKFRSRPESKYSKNDHLELDFGLSSLDRIELLCQLQEHYTMQLDEDTFARLSTIGEISSWLEEKRNALATGPSAPERAETTSSTTPRWTRMLAVRLFRDIAHAVLIVPIFRRYTDFSVTGLEHLETISPPVIFAANHTSNLDTVAVLSALPYFWRRKLAPAIRQEYFSAHFHKGGFTLKSQIRSSFEYYLACTLFNTFPIPQTMGGIQKTLKYAGELVEAGYCPLLFPEGARSEDGSMKPFRPGIGVMAIHLQVPLVPVFIGGLFEVLSRNDDWPKPGRCTLRIGVPLTISRKLDPKLATQKVEAAIRKLAS